MTDSKHKLRDSLTGIARKQLQQTLRQSLGVSSNAAMFESRGQSWHTTQGEERQEAISRQLLEKHLREADFSETRFIETLSERLSDPGILPPVKVDKQQLAREKKHGKPCRKPREGSHIRLCLRVNRLAALQKEREAGERVEAVTLDRYCDKGHFVKTVDTITAEERERLLREAEPKQITYRLYARNSFREPWELTLETQDKTEVRKEQLRHDREELYSKTVEV